MSCFYFLVKSNSGAIRVDGSAQQCLIEIQRDFVSSQQFQDTEVPHNMAVVFYNQLITLHPEFLN